MNALGFAYGIPRVWILLASSSALGLDIESLAIVKYR